MPQHRPFIALPCLPAFITTLAPNATTKQRPGCPSQNLRYAIFEALYDLFCPFYTPKQPAPYAPSPPVLTDKKEALFFSLHSYKTYPTLQNLGMYFGLSDSAASPYLELLKPCLKAALRQRQALAKRLFTGQKDFDTTFAGIQDLFIDATEIPVERPVNHDVQRSQ